VNAVEPSDTWRARALRGAPLAPLFLGVAGIVAVAFRGSWGALRDAALACHFDHSAAVLYPWGVDGLQIEAIIAAVVLRHDRWARNYCFGIIGGYTVASLAINYMHGLGKFTTDPATGHPPVPPKYVVALIAALVIGSIFLGSHLLVYIWRHVFPEPPTAIAEQMTSTAGTLSAEPGTGVPALPPTAIEQAEKAYRVSLHPDLKTLTVNDLHERYGVSVREARTVRKKVNTETAQPAEASDLAEAIGEPSQNGQGTP
jgi:hypothetical protein